MLFFIFMMKIHHEFWETKAKTCLFRQQNYKNMK